MISISCPVKQDYIIEHLEKNEKYDFRFVEKKGLKIFFEVTCDDIDLAIKEAKSWIKSTDIGSVLYFVVEAV